MRKRKSLGVSIVWWWGVGRGTPRVVDLLCGPLDACLQIIVRRQSCIYVIMLNNKNVFLLIFVFSHSTFFFFFIFFPLLSDFWCYTNNSLENLRHLCTKNVWDFSFSFNHIKLFQNCQNFLVIGCPWCNFFTF